MRKIIIILILVLAFQIYETFSQSYTRLTNDPEWDISPAWSHDGTRIAFTSGRGGNKNQIYIYSLIDSSISKLELTGYQNWVYQSPAWSSDDKKIAFWMSFDYTYYIGPEIYVVSSSGGIPTKLTNMNGFPTTPYWSPDDSLLLFASRPNLFTPNEDIYTIPSRGGTPTMIRRNYGYASPCWSPDGKKIAFSSSDSSWTYSHISVLELSTGISQEITNGGSDGSPAWSPDGKWIAYVEKSFDINKNPQQEWNIFVVPFEGGQKVQLTQSWRDDHFYWNGHPNWSPDGTKLVFSTFNQPSFGPSDIWILSAILTNIESEELKKMIPNRISLHQNYPNPFNSQTNISFELEHQDKISISIFNLKGQMVAEIFKGIKGPGFHAITWNAGNLSAGMYIIKMKAGSCYQIKKCVLLK